MPRKAKLDIKMPDTRFEEHVDETKLSSRSERSTPDKASTFTSAAAEIDLDVAMPLDDKSLRSAGKQESLISDMTIQEDSLIESVFDDSIIPSKSLSNSKTLQRNSSTANSSRFSGHEKRTRTTPRSEGGKESIKSSEILRGKVPSDNSLIKKQLRLSGKLNEKISKERLNPKKRSIKDKVIMKTLKEVDSKAQDDTRSLHDDSVVEESIGTMENGSEIISELSRAEESSVAKIEDSVLGDSKHLTDENASVASNSSKRLTAENGYANDTFEDISSSTIQSQREKMINGKIEVVDKGESSKKIDIVEYKSYQDTRTEQDR